MRVLKTVSLIALVGAASLLGGCATKESVEHAQATADQARSDAAGARGAADRAQSTADGAAKSAQDAMASAQSANDKVDKLISDMEKRRHTAAMHRRHHHRHVASAEQNSAACPPQQKTELKTHSKQAANTKRPVANKHAANDNGALQLASSHEKTARN